MKKIELNKEQKKEEKIKINIFQKKKIKKKLKKLKIEQFLQRSNFHPKKRKWPKSLKQEFSLKKGLGSTHIP